MLNKQNILSFKHTFLSNFRPAPIRIGSILFPSTEHAYQYYKFTSFDWLDKNIFFSWTAKELKKFIDSIWDNKSENHKHNVLIDQKWDKKKSNVMLFLNTLKYTQNKLLAKKLLQTWDSKLIEWNDRHDNYWWVCNCWWNHCLQYIWKWKNKLGKILMNIRSLLKKST